MPSSASAGLRREAHLAVHCDDAWVLFDVDSKARSIRDPPELVVQSLTSHHYSDGFMPLLAQRV
jgi:hypothetical protein